MKEFDNSLELPGFYNFIRLEKPYTFLTFNRSEILPGMKALIEDESIKEMIEEGGQNIISFDEDMEGVD